MAHAMHTTWKVGQTKRWTLRGSQTIWTNPDCSRKLGPMLPGHKCWQNITWNDVYYMVHSASVCFTYNFQHCLIQFPINFYSLIHHNYLLIILTAISSEDITMQPIPSEPSMLNLSSQFSIDTVDIVEAHRLHNIVHSLLPPTPSVSTFARSSTSILRPSTNLACTRRHSLFQPFPPTLRIPGGDKLLQNQRQIQSLRGRVYTPWCHRATTLPLSDPSEWLPTSSCSFQIRMVVQFQATPQEVLSLLLLWCWWLFTWSHGLIEEQVSEPLAESKRWYWWIFFCSFTWLIAFSHDLPHDCSFSLFNLFFPMLTHCVLFLDLYPYPYSSNFPFGNPRSHALSLLCQTPCTPFSHHIASSTPLLCRYHIVCDLGICIYKGSIAYCKINQEVFSLSLTSKSKSKLKFYRSKFKTGRRLPVVFDSCLRSSPVKSSSHIA